MKIVQYAHHGDKVWVRADLKGKHREHCLCFSCACFHPFDRANNCPIANDLSRLCQTYGLVAPVYECSEYEDR